MSLTFMAVVSRRRSLQTVNIWPVCEPIAPLFFPLEFVLYDVNSGDAILRKREFIGPVSAQAAALTYFYLMRGGFHVAEMAFSPDGRYFVLGRPEKHLLVDLNARQELNMPGELRRVTSRSFAFIGPDKIVGADKEDLQEASIVKFPSGGIASEHISLGGRTLHSVTSGPYAIVRPMLKAPLGIVDLNTGKIFRASHRDTTDIFGDVLVSERVNGELGLYHVRDEKPFATATLPNAPLGRISNATVGPQASTIAVSQMSRGAIWNLKTGEQLAYGPGFRGAFFANDGIYIDFPPTDQFRELPRQGETETDLRRREFEEPGDALWRLDLTGRSTTPVFTTKKRTQVQQFGSVLLAWTAADDDHPEKDITLEARDVQTGRVMWSRVFNKGLPRIEAASGFELGVFSWDLGSKSSKEKLASDAEAKELVIAANATEGSYLVEVVDLRSGTSLARFVVDTGRTSFAALHLLAAGTTVAMLDNYHRIILYSFKGEKKGRLFGGEVSFSPDGQRLCVEREPGRLVLYDTQSLKELDEMTFGDRLAYFGFAPDGQQLVVLTADQTAYVFGSQLAVTN